MVDVASKRVTQRVAIAHARIRMAKETADALRAATLPKGDAFVAAQLAGIVAAKKTPDLIPLTHTLPLSSVDVTFAWVEPALLQVEATARTAAQTGVEMEALTAAAIAALTIYDMTKSLERGIVIESLRLVHKSGGKSGTWDAKP
jgi:cyclic pyranopterin monophosphate synthase